MGFSSNSWMRRSASRRHRRRVFGCIGRDVTSLVAAHSQATMAAADGRRSVSDCPSMSPPDKLGQPLRVLDHPTTSAKVDELTTPGCMAARPAISATSLSCWVVCTPPRRWGFCRSFTSGIPGSWPPPCSLQEPRGGGRIATSMVTEAIPRPGLRCRGSAPLVP
jgi:hypothetical protein